MSIPFPRTTPAAGSTHPQTNAQFYRRTLVAIIGMAALLVLVFHNLVDYPQTWFDEGSHLHVPKTLALHGVYADYSHDGFRYFGPTVGVGPTVLLPIAVAFKLWGVGLLEARMVMVVYLILASLIFFKFAEHVGGWRFAWLATALLVATRGVALLEYGRQVLGEVPGLLFMIWGLWLWFTSWERGSLWRSVGVGLLFGAAMVTKSQYFIVLAPALLFACAVNFHYRSTRWRGLLLPGILAAAVFAGWQAYLVVYLGPATAGENLRWYREAMAGAALLFSPERTARSLAELLTAKVYLGLLLPALAYGLTLCRARDRCGHQWAILWVIVVVNVIWYAVASIGWLRYAFPALALGSLFVARALHDLTNGFDFSWAAIRAAWRTARLNREMLDPRSPRWRAVWGVFTLILIGAPLYPTVSQIINPPFNAPLAMAAYMQTHVPADKLVATWEEEMGFLTGHRYAYPPQSLLPKAVNHIWADGPEVAEFYNFEDERPDYVLVGRFGQWVEVYPAARLQSGYTRIYSTEGYELFAANR